MHVAFNATFWDRPHTGSGQYIRQLVTHLRRLAPDVTITLVYPQLPGGRPPEGVPDGVGVHVVPLRPGHVGKVLFEQRGFPDACRRLGATVAHVPYFGPPLRSPAPLVVTVHDLSLIHI